MKKILIPADFTEVSINAINFARNAEGPDAEYHVVHVHSGNLSTRDELHLEPGKTVSDSIEAQLEEVIIENLDFDKLPHNIKVHALTGDIVNSVRDFDKEQDFDCIYCGTRDKYDMFDRWFGTVSLGFAKSMDKPLYLIPRYSEFKGFEKVLVASDDHLQKKGIIHQIIEWNDKHRAYIKFLHLYSDESDDYRKESEAIITELFEERNPDFGFEVSVAKSTDITESLLANAYNFKADLLVLITESQSFINTLLFQSVSKKVILKSTIPILILHGN